MNDRAITEENDKALLDEWKADAGKVTVDDLPAFIRKLTTEYQHDYGTIVHACHAAMLAALSAVNKGPQGGITGFQASCLGWMLIEDMLGIPKDTPARLINFDDLLFPQYEPRFRSIPASVWQWLKERAAGNLKASPHAHPAVIAHWRSIVDGHVPFGLQVEQ